MKRERTVQSIRSLLYCREDFRICGKSAGILKYDAGDLQKRIFNRRILFFSTVVMALL